ncbi:D-allulose 6-phosphate 3-epimerase [Gilliamella sp. Gris1-4]|uniref:D-allulose 6-phosphate 3-epimerase n=1 Tax=Gilliamella sp. Gris1-4 TaxID=3120244 RepID=UPI00080D9E05|nr:D-allulose 6-phosphate 3-epimerase [Gilliamella apicola]OCG35349.1 allulose-6-phosphate 3-epimerase [Gilliamella apicola]
MQCRISPSLMCMDLMNIKEQLMFFNQHADFLHVDIMDGHFVKNITLSAFFIEQIKPYTCIPIDVHLMVENPTDFIDQMANAGADFICPHAETINTNAFRVINHIHQLNKKVGVVINPATPISQYIHLLDKITVMTVDPGYAGQPFIPEMLEKIRKLSELKKKNSFKFLIEVDGSCNINTYQQLLSVGAEVLIMGSSGLFKKNLSLENAWQKMSFDINNAAKNINQ